MSLMNKQKLMDDAGKRHEDHAATLRGLSSWVAPDRLEQVPATTRSLEMDGNCTLVNTESSTLDRVLCARPCQELSPDSPPGCPCSLRRCTWPPGR